MKWALSPDITPLKETVKTAFEAGVDILLLYTRYDIEKMIDLVEELLDEGSLSEQVLNEGVERILTLKYNYHLISEIEK